MSTRTVRFLPQTQITLRANSTLQFSDMLDVSGFDQVIAELVFMSPPTLAANDIELHTKTASEPIPNEGFDAFPQKTLGCDVTAAGTAAVFRGAIWQREYNSSSNPFPLLALLAFALENNTASTITFDVAINVIGTGCNCGG